MNYTREFIDKWFSPNVHCASVSISRMHLCKLHLLLRLTNKFLIETLAILVCLYLFMPALNAIISRLHAFLRNRWKVNEPRSVDLQRIKVGNQVRLGKKLITTPYRYSTSIWRSTRQSLHLKLTRYMISPVGYTMLDCGIGVFIAQLICWGGYLSRDSLDISIAQWRFLAGCPGQWIRSADTSV